MIDGEAASLPVARRQPPLELLLYRPGQAGLAGGGSQPATRHPWLSVAELSEERASSQSASQPLYRLWEDAHNTGLLPR